MYSAVLKFYTLLGGLACCSGCFQARQNLMQGIVGLLAMCGVERVPHCDGTALAGTHRLHAVVITGIESYHTTTPRDHRRL